MASSQAYELLTKVKDLSYISSASRDNYLLQRLNLAEWRLYTMEYHWRGLEKYKNLTTVAHQSYLPSNTEIGVIYTIRQVSSTPYQKLWFLSVPKFHEFIPQPTLYAENKPTHYTWWGPNLWFYPIPDAAYTLTVFYYAQPIGMKIYNIGTASLAGTTVTGTSTYFQDNSNVDTNMYFAFTADARPDGTLPWSAISNVGDNTTLTIAAYTGTTTTGAYVCSSPSIFPKDFDLALIYQSAIWENMRNRDMGQSVQLMKTEYQEAFSGLLKTQRAYPDLVVEAGRFMTEPFILGDDAAKFPFIAGNPLQ